MPWNFHEASPGAYDFSTPWRDLSRFLSLAQQKDLYVIMRAGPYMCGEWEYGGFPAWLLSNGTLTLRTYAEPYVTHATRYWRKLLGSIIKPLLFENGGPIIMTQVENEYGSYGDVSSSASDKRYIEHLVQTARDALGPNALLFTTDGGNAGYMRRGSLPGDAVLTVGDGCSDPAATWAAQKQFNPPGRSPFICAELYPGWLTHWGDQKMANTSSAAAAANLDASLSAANGTGSASLYMAHGGTSFGWWAGANGGGGSSYQPDITSYDYDAPLSEGGEHGFGSDGVDKFAALAAVLRKHTPASEPLPPPEPPLRRRVAFGHVAMHQSAAFLSNAMRMAPTAAASAQPEPPTGVESLGCYGGGFAHIEAALTTAVAAGTLTLPRVQDRALVFSRASAAAPLMYHGAVYRTDAHAHLPLPALPAGATLTILLELLGRINFSHGMDDDRFGLLGGALLDGTALAATFTTRCLPLTAPQLAAIEWTPIGANRDGPRFYRGTFSADTAGVDTYLTLPGWAKGAAWVNGFHLGRYWNEQGPQKALYVPGPVIKAGEGNEVLVLELHNASANATVELVDRAVWA